MRCRKIAQKRLTQEDNARSATVGQSTTAEEGFQVTKSIKVHLFSVLRMQHPVNLRALIDQQEQAAAIGMLKGVE